MAGHSKWANIKHRKAAQDAKRGREFQKHIRAIMVAAREGGADPALNIRLKAVLERARAANVPNDNIEKAIKKGVGDIEGVRYEEVIYEGYGTSGVAVKVETLTDNRNRTASDMRYIFSRNGGTLGETGCVSWLFDRKGIIYVKGENLDEDELLLTCLDAGAEDMTKTEEGYSISTDPSSIPEVRDALEKAGYHVVKTEIDMIPKTTVSITSSEDAAKILKLIDALEDHDDVQKVYANFDIPDDILEGMAG